MSPSGAGCTTRDRGRSYSKIFRWILCLIASYPGCVGRIARISLISVMFNLSTLRPVLAPVCLLPGTHRLTRAGPHTATPAVGVYAASPSRCWFLILSTNVYWAYEWRQDSSEIDNDLSLVWCVKIGTRFTLWLGFQFSRRRKLRSTRQDFFMIREHALHEHRPGPVRTLVWRPVPSASGAFEPTQPAEGS